MRALILSATLTAAFLLGLAPSSAEAHGPRGRFGRPSIRYYYPGYFGGYYFGRGGHDVVPHWHQTYTPFGSFSWYGLGPHDFVPHAHTYDPFSYRGYSYTPWSYTESYYSPYPYYYAPW
ncbi:MAG TPA: hypothetical protein VNK04_22025 [Gemmataceae bacterium]|nr:hypothetical protein [Gemmataceae bacterium]